MRPLETVTVDREELEPIQGTNDVAKIMSQEFIIRVKDRHCAPHGFVPRGPLRPTDSRPRKYITITPTLPLERGPYAVRAIVLGHHRVVFR